MKKTIWIAALVLASQTAWASFSFATNPVNGAITGPPGATIGWGFTLVNDVPNTYVVLTNSIFSQLTGPGIGPYQDFLAGTFFPVGQATTTTWTQSFDNSIPTGLGSFTINPGTPIGDFITGNITIFYDLYSDPQATNLISSNNSFAPSFVSVGVAPEPATLGLAAMALGLLALARNRLMKS